MSDVGQSETSKAVINNLEEIVNLNPYIEFIEDPTATFSFAEAQGNNLTWKHNNLNNFAVKNYQAVLWFKFIVEYRDDLATAKPVLYIFSNPLRLHKQLSHSFLHFQ